MGHAFVLHNIAMISCGNRPTAKQTIDPQERGDVNVKVVLIIREGNRISTLVLFKSADAKI